MAKLNIAIKKAEVNELYRKAMVIVKIIIIPIIIFSIFSSITFLSKKINGDMPTLFNTSVYTIEENIPNSNYKKGDKIAIKRVELDQIQIGDYICFYEPIEEPLENGSKIKFSLVRDIQDDAENGLIFAVRNSGEFIVGKAVIGVQEKSSSFLIGIIEFLSSKYTLIFCNIMPLSIILVFLILYSIEIKNVEKTNQELVENINIKEVSKNNIEGAKINTANYERDSLFASSVNLNNKADARKEKQPPRPYGAENNKSKEDISKQTTNMSDNQQKVVLPKNHKTSDDKNKKETELSSQKSINKQVAPPKPALKPSSIPTKPVRPSEDLSKKSITPPRPIPVKPPQKPSGPPVKPPQKPSGPPVKPPAKPKK